MSGDDFNTLQRRKTIVCLCLMFAAQNHSIMLAGVTAALAASFFWSWRILLKGGSL
jgi:hypothetical protein